MQHDPVQIGTVRRHLPADRGVPWPEGRNWFLSGSISTGSGRGSGKGSMAAEQRGQPCGGPGSRALLEENLFLKGGWVGQPDFGKYSD